MSESTVTLPAASDAAGLRALLDAGETVAVWFEGCPLPGTLTMVHDDGTLDVTVHDDGRQDGTHYVDPRTVTSLELG